ncbi:hypothetical protein J6590_079089 [Homalodisca vitripennis]|nr:hypothetical protein J6590_079089 [Homalodisca vitripennis]
MQALIQERGRPFPQERQAIHHERDSPYYKRDAGSNPRERNAIFHKRGKLYTTRDTIDVGHIPQERQAIHHERDNPYYKRDAGSNPRERKAIFHKRGKLYTTRDTVHTIREMQALIQDRGSYPRERKAIFYKRGKLYTTRDTVHTIREMQALNPRERKAIFHKRGKLYTTRDTALILERGRPYSHEVITTKLYGRNTTHKYESEPESLQAPRVQDVYSAVNDEVPMMKCRLNQSHYDGESLYSTVTVLLVLPLTEHLSYLQGVHELSGNIWKFVHRLERSKINVS